MLDALVIGGGFYGASVAAYLCRKRGFRDVRLVEREPALMQRASYNNQARIHNGYHYPRSFTTAYRSRVNLPRFVRDYPDVVKSDFTKVYAIARNNSKVTARQFERFCREIGVPLESAPSPIRSLFEPRLIESVYLAEEFAFDTTALKDQMTNALCDAGVDVRLNTAVHELFRRGSKPGLVARCIHQGTVEEVEARYVFNCTYSGLNHIGGSFPGTVSALKHEITEMALVELPEELRNLGVTVMDGAFFSLMPFPARRLHTLSHVRYTPHLSWKDQRDRNPYANLDSYERPTHVDRMIRDAARYMPSISRVRCSGSLFEIKTVLLKNEGDDGRPILFERHADLPGCYSMLGGKIDNIYDALQKLDDEPLALAPIGDALREEKLT